MKIVIAFNSGGIDFTRIYADRSEEMRLALLSGKDSEGVRLTKNQCQCIDAFLEGASSLVFYSAAERDQFACVASGITYRIRRNADIMELSKVSEIGRTHNFSPHEIAELLARERC